MALNGHPYNAQNYFSQMAKKSAPAALSGLESIIDGAKKTALDILTRTIHEKIKKFEKITLEIALGLLFFTIGLFFILTAVVFFLNQFAHVSYFSGFFLVGILAMVAAFVFYYLAKHN